MKRGYEQYSTSYPAQQQEGYQYQGQSYNTYDHSGQNNQSYESKRNKNDGTYPQSDWSSSAGENWSYGNQQSVGYSNQSYGADSVQTGAYGNQAYDYRNQSYGEETYDDGTWNTYDGGNQQHYDSNYEDNQGYREWNHYGRDNDQSYYHEGYQEGGDYYRQRRRRRPKRREIDPAEDLLRFNLQVISDKLKEINPDATKRERTSKLVTVTMMVLNNCATVLSQEETKYPVKPEPVLDEENSLVELQVKREIIDEETPKVEPEQVLLGVVRTGLAKRKLLLDTTVEIGDELIVLTNNKPTKPLISKILEFLKLNVNLKLKDSVTEATVTLLPNHSIVIAYNLPDPHHKVLVRFSSPQYSQDLAEEYKLTCEANDLLLLSETECADALAKIRQMRWYDNEICLRLEAPVIRLVLSLSHKVEQFRYLTLDAIQVLVTNATQQLGDEANRYSLFVHVLKALAGGILLAHGRGLMCPWDRRVDASELILPQERENITTGSQQALRMVLLYGVEKLLF